MRRLFLQVYVTVVASLVLFALLAAVAWQTLISASPQIYGADMAAEIAAAVLPGPTEPADRQREALRKLSAGGRLDMALFAADGSAIAEVGHALPAPDTAGRRHPVLTPLGLVWSVVLRDGRELSVRLPRAHRSHPALGLFIALVLVGVAVALGAYPVTRRLTRRLERLKVSVEALGAGDLSARVSVEGHDEIAAVATSFNGAAERIERLVGGHKTLLANASHELRSPLARIRMAMGLLPAPPDPGLAAEIERNVAELDELVEEILLASRLDLSDEPLSRHPVDLLALAAEECARTGAVLDGITTQVYGDARLLRRLIRNLLENARRHAGIGAADVSLASGPDGTCILRVCDRGPGIAEDQRVRIFEPFYRPPQAREKEGGHGLGLALVRQIAARHGGTVRCVPREGGGMCFEVMLPAGSGDPGPVAGRATRPPGMS